MDIIDKRILYYLLKDGRVSQRKIASELNLTPASLNYRFNKLAENRTLKGFKLYVNPNFYGKYHLYIAFKNHNDIDADWISFKLKCLEWLNVYNIYGSSLDDLKDKIDYMKKQLGEPVMSYTPLQSLFRPSELDKKIVDVLRQAPRLPPSDIAKKLNISSKVVEKHIRYLRYRGLLMVVPEIDIGKADIVVFSIFSKNIDEITTVLQEYKLWQFTDGYSGITVCYADNMEQAKKLINAARQVDKNADVMVIYDYVFK